MPSVSALSRFSASSNDMRVRVLGSKNRLMIVRPRSVGTFLIGRVPTSFIASAVSRIRSISAGSRSAMPSRWRLRSAVAARHPSTSTSSRPSISVQPHLHALLARRRDVAADVVGANRQLAMAAIDERDELNRARPAEVDERVERRANRPARVAARRRRAGSAGRRWRTGSPCGGSPAAARRRGASGRRDRA